MKKSKTFGFEIAISALLTGCVIGNGTICGPGTPVAYCDREVYEKLTHPKPYLDYWEKSTMAIKQRQEDWLNCGGKDDGTFAPTKKSLAAERRKEERDNISAYDRLSNNLDRCMIKKGYHYTGSCTSEIMKAVPACGAP